MGMTRLLEMYLISGCMWYFFSGLERKEEELGSFSASFPQANSNSNLTGFFFFAVPLLRKRKNSRNIKREKEEYSSQMPWSGYPLFSFPRGFKNFLCPLLIFRSLAKPTSGMNLKCSWTWKSSCCSLWDGYGYTQHSTTGYNYKTEFIVRKILEAGKHYTSSPEVSLFHTQMCLGWVWLSWM